jgi:ribonuclease Z
MPGPRAFRELRLVNGSTGDPALFVDDPGRNNALLIDCGENAALGDDRLGDLEAVFLTHHHIDHFIGFDRIVRANLDRDKALHVYGPGGTIRKVYQRIKSYEFPFFPFQKVVLEVVEVWPDRLRAARLECARRFPRPRVAESPCSGPVVYRSEGLSVEAAFADHTVPCLAFALVEEPAATPGARIAYVTDTAWSEASRPGLLRLARGARRLYCDAFYAEAQRPQAEKYRHMTATQAAEFAREAGVGELVLIHFASRYKGCYEALVEEARAVFPDTTAEIPTTAAKNSARDAKHS